MQLQNDMTRGASAPSIERGMQPLRAILFGVLLGAFLAAMRAPPGLSWTEVPCPRGATSALFRAVPWIALALMLDTRRRAFSTGLSIPALLFGSAAGFLGWSSFFAARFRPESRPGFALMFVIGTAALWLAAGRKKTVDSGSSAPGSSWTARSGLFLCAAGAAIALENLAHHARLFGLGLPEDDAVIGAVFLLLLGLGAISFGGLLARPGTERALLGAGLVFAASSTLAGLVFLQGLDADRLFAYLKRFGLDTSSIGTLPTTALLAAASLVAPGLIAGAALRGARAAVELSSLALGAAAGLLLHPFASQALARAFPAANGSSWSWNLLAAGTALATAGALVYLSKSERGRRRTLGWILVVAAALVPLARPRYAFTRFSPWFPAPIEPELVLPTSAGLMTVEPFTDGSRIVTLDRKRVSPIAAEERVDEQRILRALSLVPRPEGRALRLLLIGQITPERARWLGWLGGLEIERTAPWFSAFPAIESILFTPDEPPPGTAVRPGEAERRIGAGHYDCVIALPAHGPLLIPKSAALIPWGSAEEPTLRSLSVPGSTVGVAWLDLNSPLVRCELGERVIYVADRFEHPSLGVVRGGGVPGTSPDRPALLPGGAPARRPETWELLSTLPRERSFALHASLFERLAQAASSTPLEELARGLALHYATQRPSSPFESVSQRIEIDEDEFRAFERAARSEVIDATTRDVWEDAAWLLTEKRETNLVFAYLEPVALKHGPWPALDWAMARAFEEILEPAEALRCLDRALEGDQLDLEALSHAADLALEIGDPARASAYLKRALETQPGRKDLEVRLCRALLEQGSAEGDALLERLRTSGLSPEELDWILGGTGQDASDEDEPASEEQASDPADGFEEP